MDLKENKDDLDDEILNLFKVYKSNFGDVNFSWSQIKKSLLKNLLMFCFLAISFL